MKSKILVVDDDKGIRTVFKSILSEQGFSVETAEDYDSAIDIILKNSIDLIFADIILPGHSGIEILKEVKNRDMMCPVIMITGDPSVKTTTEAVRMDAFDYLAKPVPKETLLQVTQRALHHKSLMEEKNRIEAEKERYRQNMEAIFRSLKDAIITVDHEMRIIEANEATNDICGFAADEIIGKKITDIETRCKKACKNIVGETLKTRNVIKEYCVECKNENKPRQVVLLTSSPLSDKNNQFMGAVLVIRDITRIADLENELKERHQFHNLVGKSAKMQEIYQLLEDLAATNTTVLITGESGTGKELVARALHYGSIRSSKPLINVNCSALAENLLETELFGHVKGAFTGAVKDKMGRFEMADGGTIFLDEVGDIPPRIQLKLLRVLQEREFERVGDSLPVKVDVRLIAATNRDLRKRVRQGEFREDLFYRLKVVEVSLPPLRERREDIPILVDHFCNMFNKKFKKNIKGMADEVMNTFMRYLWPGNIRELEHAVEHAFVLCHGRTITVDHLPSEIKEYSKKAGHTPDRKPIDEPRKILQILNKADWNKAKAARLLGISRQTIYRKINEYKLSRPLE